MKAKSGKAKSENEAGTQASKWRHKTWTKGNGGPSTFGSKASVLELVSLVRVGGPGVACYGQARLCLAGTTTGVTLTGALRGIASNLSADLFGHDREAWFFRSLVYESAGWTTGPWLRAGARCWPLTGPATLTWAEMMRAYTLTGRVLACAHKRVVETRVRWVWGWDSRCKIILENRARCAIGLQFCAHGLRLCWLAEKCAIYRTQLVDGGLGRETEGKGLGASKRKAGKRRAKNENGEGR